MRGSAATPRRALALPRVGAALLAAGLLGGCADAGLAWSYALDPGLGEVETIGAFVREGSCDGEPRSYFFARGEEGPMPAPLEGGTWCFEVAAYDADCVALGRGQTLLTLPPEGTDEVRVEVAPTGPEDPDDACLFYVAGRESEAP